MKRIPKDYQELLQNFKDLAIERYGLDTLLDENEDGELVPIFADLVEEIQAATTLKEIAEILEEEELDGAIKILEDSLQTWFSPH